MELNSSQRGGVPHKESVHKGSPYQDSSLGSIGGAMFYSIKKMGLSHLLFKNEDRRDFCSHAYTQQKKHVAENVLSKGKEANFATQQNFKKSQASHRLTVQEGAEKQALTSFREPTQLNQFTQPNQNFEAQQSTRGIENLAHATKQDFEQSKGKGLPIELWPEIWQKMHTRFSLPLAENKTSQVRVAWTYEGLEQDALGIANVERQAIMKKILVSLNHKKGTHSFIPYSIPHEDGISRLAMHEQSSFFWSAMRLVNPRILLVFGSQARDILQIPKLRPLQKIDIGTLRILQMHKPETLVTDSTHLAVTLAFLQDSLRMCASK